MFDNQFPAEFSFIITQPFVHNFFDGVKMPVAADDRLSKTNCLDGNENVIARHGQAFALNRRSKMAAARQSSGPNG